MLIKNGNVISKDGVILKNTDVYFKNGKILEVAPNLRVADDELILDDSYYVSPGFVESHCHTGMWEMVNGEAGADGNEATDPITPHLRAIDGVNPMDEGFDDAVKGGITTICTGPGSTNVMGGSFCIMKTFGKRVDDMLIKDIYGIKCAYGENPKSTYGIDDKMPQTRMGIAALMRETLYKTKEYLAEKESESGTVYDIKMESLIPVIKKEIPLKTHAHRADDIFTAIRIAKEFDIDITLDHCTEAHLIADWLVDVDYPIIIGPTFGEKTKYELLYKSFETPKVLFDKGIAFSIMTDAPELPIESLPMCAALAVKAGLPESEALKAISINPAITLGIADRVGSLEKGKDADIVIWDKNPLDIQAKVLKVYIDGNLVYDRGVI